MTSVGVLGRPCFSPNTPHGAGHFGMQVGFRHPGQPCAPLARASELRKTPSVLHFLDCGFATFANFDVECLPVSSLSDAKITPFSPCEKTRPSLGLCFQTSPLPGQCRAGMVVLPPASGQCGLGQQAPESPAASPCPFSLLEWCSHTSAFLRAGAAEPREPLDAGQLLLRVLACPARAVVAFMS